MIYSISKQGEVTLGGILRPYLSHRIGNLQCGFHVRLPALGQAKIQGHAVYVRIYRDDQLGGINIPQTKINRAILSRHPSEQHVEPLAGLFGVLRETLDIIEHINEFH